MSNKTQFSVGDIVLVSDDNKTWFEVCYSGTNDPDVKYGFERRYASKGGGWWKYCKHIN